MPNEIKINDDIKILVDGEIIGKLTSFDPSTGEKKEVYQLSEEPYEELYFPGEKTVIAGTMTNILLGTITPRSGELTVIHNEDTPIALSWTCSETIGIGVVNARSVSSMFIKPSWQTRMREIIKNG